MISPIDPGFSHSQLILYVILVVNFYMRKAIATFYLFFLYSSNEHWTTQSMKYCIDL